MLVMTNSQPELEKIIQEFTNLQIEWNLKLNKKKSEILTKEQIPDINGVKCTASVKYLGVRVVLDKKEQKESAKAQINKNVGLLKWRLKRASPDVL